jgi:hypothetical protein
VDCGHLIHQHQDLYRLLLASLGGPSPVLAVGALHDYRSGIGLRMLQNSDFRRNSYPLALYNWFGILPHTSV